MKKDILKNFPKFTGKHLCQSLFLIKLQTEACDFIKKETLAQVFSCKFFETFKSAFFTDHLRTTASEKPWFLLRNLLKTINPLINQFGE